MQATSSPKIDQVRDMVILGVRNALATMVGIDAVPGSAEEYKVDEPSCVAGSVGFTGGVTGVVYVQIGEKFARVLASKMLGMSEHEVVPELITDVIGELTNMFVGSVKSKLCDQGFPCVLTIPSVVRGRGLVVVSASSSERRTVGFRCGTHCIHVELILKVGG
jgi:CheY-specific phosphatase CheX